ncbi:hypothetical protein ES332_D07G110100v1 [Gossypium tomentosum]|uniref:Uncharacterized protein n=1 Tax=Gossypium tomentosum TaxID=34277 RepID=A0A5D2K6U5_GOSTO|nr:hypothetical protein ES332_D07G110100v1 [Gossypium tomentosum]
MELTDSAKGTREELDTLKFLFGPQNILLKFFPCRLSFTFLPLLLSLWSEDDLTTEANPFPAFEMGGLREPFSLKIISLCFPASSSPSLTPTSNSIVPPKVGLK